PSFIRERYRPIFVCDMPGRKSIITADCRSGGFVADVGEGGGGSKKMAPENRGHGPNHRRSLDCACSRKVCIFSLRDRNGGDRRCGWQCGCWRSKGGRWKPSDGRTGCWRAGG